MKPKDSIKILMEAYNRNIRTFSSFLILSFVLLLVQACGDDPTRIDYSTVPPPYVDIAQTPPDSTTNDGLQFYFIEEGSGPFEVNSNDEIRVRYTGRTADDGEVFESTYANGFDSPRVFRNLTPEPKNTGGQQIGPLIDGMRRGLLGMKAGEKRTIVIPPELGYGNSEDGQSRSGLQDETLVFDVELVDILQ